MTASNASKKRPSYPSTPSITKEEVAQHRDSERRLNQATYHEQQDYFLALERVQLLRSDRKRVEEDLRQITALGGNWEQRKYLRGLIESMTIRINWAENEREAAWLALQKARRDWLARSTT